MDKPKTTSLTGLRRQVESVTKPEDNSKSTQVEPVEPKPKRASKAKKEKVKEKPTTEKVKPLSLMVPLDVYEALMMGKVRDLGSMKDQVIELVRAREKKLSKPS